MLERQQKKILVDRLEHEPRRFIQVITGPRQVGKTTLAQQFMESSNLPVHFISADLVPAGSTAWISQQWNTARIKLRQSNAHALVLIIDEIQKITAWSEAVKKEWDTDTQEKNDIRLLILGSSRLLLQQGLTESLAGRFETLHLGHWSYTEMHSAFNFSPSQYVFFGGYPGAAPLIHDEQRWAHYITDSLIETSISKDVLMLTRVEKPALLKKLFELGCLYSGQILSYTKIMGQLHEAGNTTTLAHYLNLLDTAGLLGGLQKYSPQVIRQRASSPKFQVHNTALLSAQQQQSLKELQQQPQLWGRWIESAIGAHLINHLRPGETELHYWRQGNDEVDFILQHKGKVIALEIKSGKEGYTKGMEAFNKQYHPDKTLLIGNEGLPWEEFLTLSPNDL